MASLTELPDELLQMILIDLVGQPAGPHEESEPEPERLAVVRQLKVLRRVSKVLARIAAPFLFGRVQAPSTLAISPSFEAFLKLKVWHLRLDGTLHIHGPAAPNLLPKFEALHWVHFDNLGRADMPAVARMLNAKGFVEHVELSFTRPLRTTHNPHWGPGPQDRTISTYGIHVHFVGVGKLQGGDLRSLMLWFLPMSRSA